MGKLTLLDHLRVCAERIKDYVDERVDAVPAGKRFARAVVGTAANGWTEDDCDYLCDGEADEIEIGKALDALNGSGGGELILLDGEYFLAAAVAVAAANVRISGAGAVITIADGKDFGSGPLFELEGENCRVDGIWFRGAAGAGLDGVQLLGAYQSVTNCRFSEIGNAGAAVFGELCTVSGNRFSMDEEGATGVYVSGVYASVTRNVFQGDGCAAIALASTEGCSVTGNSGMNTAIRVIGSGENAISGNSCLLTTE